MHESDVVIVGGGHNGLVCAFYLARAGLSVTVLERRGIVGGAAVTEEFAPGFRNSVASYTVSLLAPKVIADMRLAEHGLSILPRRVQNFLPLNDRDYLLTGEGRTKSEVAKFSARDAARLDAFTDRLTVLADLVRETLLKSPPNVTQSGWLAALGEMIRGIPLARLVGRTDIAAKRDLLALFGQSAGDWLDGWFESGAIKAAFGFDAIVGNYASPYSPGTGYVLLHHAIGEVNGRKGTWGHAIGGMGAITQAMAAECAKRGVDLRTNASVREILVEKGRAVGAVTETGEIFRGRAVISNLNPKLLFQSLVDPELLPADFRERIARYRCASGTFRMNVALSELPRFPACPRRAIISRPASSWRRALATWSAPIADARAFGWSKAPIVEMLIPSFVDDTLAPPGKHVASLFCQHVAPELPDGFMGRASRRSRRSDDRYGRSVSRRGSRRR
jgi:phytoene dehydrogenase-like protein